jgi:tetratricopeptide (TPR) repeat protein
MLAAGERKEAAAVLKSLAEGDDALAVAIIDQADLLVDEGKVEEAIALYDKALAKSKDHPLAVLGRAVARAESTINPAAAIEDLSVKLDKQLGPRVAAWRNLATALAHHSIEDYPRSAQELEDAKTKKPPSEPRFWARVAWMHYVRGEFAKAADARSRIAWFGKKAAEDDPAVELVDAALLIASGLPDKALDIAAKLDGIRPMMLRTYALLDLKKPKEALGEAEKILEKAPENLEAQLLKEQARMLASEGKERTAASDALEKLMRKAKSKIGRHALGVALHAVGNDADARTHLQAALSDITEDEPNPLAYRTRTTLAEILVAAGEIEAAGKQLDEVLTKDNPGYFPTRIMQAKVVLRTNQPDRALTLLVPIKKEVDLPEVDLMMIEAACSSTKVSAKQKDEAKKALPALKDKITPVDELVRVAALCDPKLPAALGLAGAAPAPAKAVKQPPPKKVRGGGRRR